MRAWAPNVQALFWDILGVHVQGGRKWPVDVRGPQAICWEIFGIHVEVYNKAAAMPGGEMISLW